MELNEFQLIQVFKIITTLKYFWLKKYTKNLQKSIIIHQREGFKIFFTEDFNYLSTLY